MLMSLLKINRLFIKFSRTDQEHTVIEFANEIIQLRDGYFAPSNALSMLLCNLKQIVDYISTAL